MLLAGASLLHSNLYNGFQAEKTNVAITLRLLQNTIQLAGEEADTVQQRTLEHLQQKRPVLIAGNI